MSEDHQVMLWCAEGISQDQVKELKAKILRHREDPDFFLITNFFLSRVEIPVGAMVMAEEASPDQIQVLKDELGRAVADTDYVAVVPFNVTVQTL